MTIEPYLTTPLQHPDPRIEKKLHKLGLYSYRDILFYFPLKVIKKHKCDSLNEVHASLRESGQPKITVAVVAKIIATDFPSSPRAPARIYLADKNEESLTITYFQGNKHYLKKRFPIGVEKLIVGEVEWFKGELHMSHPQNVLESQKIKTLPSVEIVYPTTPGLFQSIINYYVDEALKAFPPMNDWWDDNFLQEKGYVGVKQSLEILHFRRHGNYRLAQERLSLDEVLAHKKSLEYSKKIAREHTSVRIDNILSVNEEKLFGFSFTADQKSAVASVYQDLQSSKRMYRMVQGDVGSGKTAVSFCAVLQLLNSGYQVAFMAPTEILARQQYETLSKWASSLGYATGLLIGKEKKTKAAKETLSKVSQGEINLVVGTHALFQQDVQFGCLGLMIIDEQHRFGVEQRLALAQKGEGVHMLYLTATPIPRTLNLLSFGDLDLSIIREKPPGRQPIQTSALKLNQISSLIERLQSQLASDSQVYWVCPLIEESETLDLTHAVYRAESLSKYFTDQVGLIHGKMKPEEKALVMQQFTDKKIKILVSTTVIEVGINVPNATIMIIEHAERFGLSQLHQLRGRVGRGAKRSYCILLYSEKISALAKQKIATMVKTEDGFVIAEKDFELRGAGDVLGTKQSGLPNFRVADVEEIGRIQKLLGYQELPMSKNRHELFTLFNLTTSEKYLISG